MVSSGKPLTQRRITAILNRAEKVAKDSVASVENPFDIPLPAYMRNAEKNPFYRDYAAKLQTMKNELDVVKKNAAGPDNSCLRDNPAWEFEQEFEEDHSNFKGVKFEYRDPATQQFVPLKGTAGYAMFLGTQIAGGFIHLERSDFREGKSDSVSSLKSYIVDTLKLFVMKTIDLYFEPDGEGPGLHEFHTLKGKNGKDIVRPLTADDIDRLGPICLANLSEV